MATKKSRDFKVVEIDPTTVEEKVTSTYQSYTWWMDLVKNESWAYLNDVFTADEIAQIIKIGGDGSTSAGNSNETLDGFQTRSWIRSDLESNNFIFHKLVNAVSTLNERFFNFDISYIDTLQFVRVDENSNISGAYIDGTYTSTGTKKLSFILHLSEGEEYSGGDVLLHTAAVPTPLPKLKGSLDIFPAYTLRDITPVTKGAGFFLIGTVVGPRFK